MPKSRTERPRKTKIGTEVAHVTRDSNTIFKVKMSKVNLRGHIVAASRTACLKFKHNLNQSTNLVAYTYIDLVRAHASTSYRKLDIHVLFINCKITSSDTMRPIFPNIAFASDKLLFCDLIMNI